MSEKYWSDWIDDIKENTERIEKLEKKNIEFSNYIHEGIGNLVLKNQKELAELKGDNKRLEEHRVLHNKTMIRFLNDWTLRVKKLESVLKERDDTILFILNALKIDDIISFEGYNKHSDKILKKLSGEKTNKCKKGLYEECNALNDKDCKFFGECFYNNSNPPEPTIEDVQPIEIQGNLYWMPKAKASQLIGEFIEFLGYYQLEWAPQLSEAMSKELFEEHKKWEARLK